MNSPTDDTKDTARLDRERIARRVNGAVAADFQAIEIRNRYVRQRSNPDPLEDIRRDLERVIALLFELTNAA